MRDIGRRLAELLRPGDVIRLEGPLGAGKTTLTQGIARGLGVDQPVTSPSFALIHEHVAVRADERFPLFHADLYRLSGLLDAESIGLDEYLDGRGVLVVEWGSRAAESLPDDGLLIRLEPVGESRDVRVEALGPRGREIAHRLAAAAGIDEYVARD